MLRNGFARGRSLGIYGMVMGVAAPVMLVATAIARLRGRLPPGALAERLGLSGPACPAPRIWLHGASVGELTSARGLLEGLLAARPDLGAIVTCNTATARAMVSGWGLARVEARLAPLDGLGASRRFLARWRPVALIVIENELWPGRIAAAAAFGPVVLVGARMSKGSARNWRRIAPRLMAATLRHLRLVSAQDAASETRLLGLGLPADRLAPRLMLKAHLAATDPGPPPFPTPHSRGRVLLAASTHEGEEGPILDAFVQARVAGVFDLMILAPRHPQRGAEVAALIAARGLSCATRSKDERPDKATAVFLADTLGEMPQWYAMAGTTVIGGTFGARGGHTPYEPAAQGSALVHGPSVHNFMESFAALDAAGGAVAVGDAAALGPALCRLTEPRQAELAAAATAALKPQDDSTALMAAILALLPDQSLSG